MNKNINSNNIINDNEKLASQNKNSNDQVDQYEGRNPIFRILHKINKPNNNSINNINSNPQDVDFLQHENPNNNANINANTNRLDYPNNNPPLNIINISNIENNQSQTLSKSNSLIQLFGIQNDADIGTGANRKPPVKRKREILVTTNTKNTNINNDANISIITNGHMYSNSSPYATNQFNNKIGDNILQQRKEKRRITQLFDRKILNINNLIKLATNQLESNNNDIQVLITKYNKETKLEIKDELKKNISLLSNKKWQITVTLIKLEQIKLTLQKLKNTNVFLKLIDFVKDNANDLIDGKIVDFNPVFNKIKYTLNNVLSDVYSYQFPALDSGLQASLIYEALSIGIRSHGYAQVDHVLKINSEGALINGVTINNSKNIYGMQLGEKTFQIGIDKTWDVANNNIIKQNR